MSVSLATTVTLPPRMQTPPRSGPSSSRKYTEEEKQQLLANLDLEVEHRARQFESTLATILENFKNHHEGQVLRVPKVVRNITMAEFGDKYHGDIGQCLRGLQRERHVGGQVDSESMARKRKWTAGSESGPSDAESSRAVKSARLIQSPTKPPSSAAQRQRIRKTPGSVRIARLPDSVTKSKAKFKLSSRPHYASPTKASSAAVAAPPPSSSSRLPSTDIFNPRLPKTPAYPRAPRKNERLMSLNGSPLANPFQLNTGIFGGGTIPEEDGEEDGEGEGGDGPDDRPKKTLRRVPSIVIRRDPSFLPSQEHGSQPSKKPPSNSSRPNSRSSQHPSRQVSALMRIPTKDGLLLEFDPLMTTPAELDALDGISESAKKQAKEDMTRLVQMALAKWKI